MDNYNMKRRKMTTFLEFEPEGSQPFTSLTKKDFFAMFILIAITAVISFVDLGNNYSPQTLWSTNEKRPVIIELNKETYVEKLMYFVGISPDKRFYLSASSDGKSWSECGEVETKSVFSWKELPIQKKLKFIKLSPRDDDLSLFEIALRGADGSLIEISSPQAVELTDEQWMTPDIPTYMNSTYFDEIYHARTAYEMLNGIRIYENTHPPLGKAIIAIGVEIFGMTPFGWRFMGTIFGILLVPAIFLFAHRMSGSRKWAIFASVLMMLDFMRFTQTRIATVDTYVTFFIILMYYFMYKYSRLSFYDSPLGKTFVPLFFSGLFMGLAIACKWTGVYAAAGLAVIFFCTLFKRLMEGLYAAKHEDNVESYNLFFGKAFKTCLFCVLAFVLIPLTIYLASYLTYFRAPEYNGIADIIKNQETMFSYHSELVSTHPYGSPWWQWPIMARPVFFYSQTIDGLKAGISTFGNPAVWWLGIIAFFAAVNLGFAKKNTNARFLIIAYLFQFLPWVLVMRTTYLYHYFPSVPFVILMIMLMFKEYSKEKHYMLIPLYPALVLALFVIFYPVLAGMPVPLSYVDMFLRWLPGWQLVL